MILARECSILSLRGASSGWQRPGRSSCRPGISSRSPTVVRSAANSLFYGRRRVVAPGKRTNSRCQLRNARIVCILGPSSTRVPDPWCNVGSFSAASTNRSRFRPFRRRAARSAVSGRSGWTRRSDSAMPTPPAGRAGCDSCCSSNGNSVRRCNRRFLYRVYRYLWACLS